MAIQLADTLAPMADFPAAMAKHVAFADGENLQQKLDDGSLGSGGGEKIGEILTKEEYDLLKEQDLIEEDKNYYIEDEDSDIDINTENGMNFYTKLSDLGLIAPVTVGDIFNAMPSKSMAVISCEDITVHITDAPTSYGILTIKKNDVGRFSIDYQSSLASSPCNVKRWIGTLKGNDGTGLYWKEVAYKDNLAIYKSLSELELDTTATLKDITRAMAKNSMIAIKVDAMANQSEYNSITQGTVTIYKIEDARIQAIMTEKTTGRTWVGILGGENTIIGWQAVIVENSRTDPYSCTGYTVLTGTEDLFTLPCGHYVSDKVNTTYNYPVTDSSNVTAHIYVLGCLNDPANNKGYRIILYFDNKGRMYGINEWWGSFGNGWQKISRSKYHSIKQLNSEKGTSIELVKGEDNTQKIMDALGVGDSFISLFHNDSSMDRFGIPASIGNRITELRIEKVLDANGTSNYCVATAFMNTGIVLNRTNYGGTLSAWASSEGTSDDVALTTIAIPNSYITGTLQWEVKKGVCYVSWENFKCTKTNFTYTLTNNKLPTPLRTICLPMYASTGEHIGVINVPKDGNTPTFVSTDKISLTSSGCFGYEIA